MCVAGHCGTHGKGAGTCCGTVLLSLTPLCLLCRPTPDTPPPPAPPHPPPHFSHGQGYGGGLLYDGSVFANFTSTIIVVLQYVPVPHPLALTPPAPVPRPCIAD
jgi:hypothetical protein